VQIPEITSQLVYLTAIFVLLVVPRALQKYRIPAPLTCFALGIGIALIGNEYLHDSTLGLFSTLGISSLFLFAGLEVNVNDLRKGVLHLTIHLLLRTLVLVAFSWGVIRYFDFSWQVAALLGLAILTPSTGFILESLSRLGINENEKFWVTSKAIAGELLALLLLFVILKSESYTTLAQSSAVLLIIAVGLPFLLIGLGRFVIPHAAGSEFSLLIMVGLIAAYLTKQIGVYYLVGAFLTGISARLLRDRLPSIASEQNLHAVKLFASFFVPFYFFYSGMSVPQGALQWNSLWIGLAVSAAVIPIRIAFITLQRVVVHKDSVKSGVRIAVALAPTLIFTLVLAGILHERYGISDALFGGLIVYAAISTMLPSLMLAKAISLDISD
jgi:Kef-type K+ transport system membrane component KefB